MKLIATALRYWHTLKYLRAVQIFNRLWRRAYRGRPRLSKEYTMRSVVRPWIDPPRLASSMREPDEFEFLGVCHRLVSPEDWNRSDWPLLWRYHLHYFDDLNAHDAASRRTWHTPLVGRWILENPPGEIPGWDPYPTSLRVVNWIKWRLNGGPLEPYHLDSVRLQVAHLEGRIEYHLLGNHLIENARALVFAGAIFEGEDAHRWLTKGMQLLMKELPQQVLADGGHCERSPMYHQKMLTALLDVLNVLHCFDIPLPEELRRAATSMLCWSLEMSHPDGDIALFQDSALDEAISPGKLSLYAAHFDICAVPRASRLIHHQPSGYARVRTGKQQSLLDVGAPGPNYQPGHAHAGLFGFELSVDQSRVIVDTGVSTYEQGHRRNWERSTAAHNTVVVCDQNSSQVWGAFRVARRAKILHSSATDAGAIVVRAAHDGYRWLRARVNHERTWTFSADEVEIKDLVDGCGEVHVQVFFNIHPDFTLSAKEGGFEVCRPAGTVVLFIQPPSSLSSVVCRFEYAPRFGRVLEGQRLAMDARLQLPCTLSSRVRWFAPNVESTSG